MSLKTGTATYTYDIGSVQTLKGIAWTGEGIVKIRYRIANERRALSLLPFVDTDTEYFSRPPLSSKFEVSKNNLSITEQNVLLISGFVDSTGQDLKYLPDAYGGEIKTVDSLGDYFTVSALMQLQIPGNLTKGGGRVYLGIKSDDGYQEEIIVQKRIVKTTGTNTNGFQEVFNNANVTVDGYSYNIFTDKGNVRLVEVAEIDEKTIEDLFVQETLSRDVFGNFVTSAVVKNLVDAYGIDAYGDAYGYIIDKNESDFFLSRDKVSNKILTDNLRKESYNFDPISNTYVIADPDNRWMTEVFLEKGTYYYNFLITRRKPSGILEEVEVQDPQNPNVYTDDFNKTYSVLDIKTPSLIIFAIFVAADKVSVVGNFNDFIPDSNLLHVGFSTDLPNPYTNSWKNWNKIDLYLNDLVYIDRVHFETLVAENDRQKIAVLLDDKPINIDEFNYTSGRNLNEFNLLPIPSVPQKQILSEFDFEFDDIPDAYGYIDSNGYVNPSILNEVLSENTDGYGLTFEEKYVNWRYRTTSSFSTDAEGAFNAIRTAIEYFKISSSTTQITLRESPVDNDVEMIRLDSFTKQFNNNSYSVDFDSSNRVIAITPELTRGVYRVSYETVIYGGTIINSGILEDAQGNRYKYVSGDPTTGATVKIEEIIIIVSETRNTFQLSHSPSSSILIEILGDHLRQLSVGISVSDNTLAFNSYLNKGTYVVFYTTVDNVKKAEAQIFSNKFNGITLLDTPILGTILLYIVENPIEEKINIINISDRVVVFNTPSQEATYQVTYKVREVDLTAGDSVWISKEDAYGEWNHVEVNGYGSTRTTTQKVSLFSRLESFSGNSRYHTAFDLYTNDGLTQTFVDFSLRYDYSKNFNLIAEFENTKEFITVAAADGTWQAPVILYTQDNKLSVSSETFGETGTVTNNGFEDIVVTVPEPYLEPFRNNVDGYGASQNTLTVLYGTEKYFIADIDDITIASDGYGELEIERINDNEWHFKRLVQTFSSYVLGKVIYINSNIVRVEKTEKLKDITVVPYESRLNSYLLVNPVLIIGVDDSNETYVELTLETSLTITPSGTDGFRIEFSQGNELVIDYIVNKKNQIVEGYNESGFAIGSLVFEYKKPIGSKPFYDLKDVILPSEDSFFNIGDSVILEVGNIQEKVRLIDTDLLQITLFFDEEHPLPTTITGQINNYSTVNLLPDQQTDGYGNFVGLDGYGVYVTYSTNLKDFFSTVDVNLSEVVQTVKFNFVTLSTQVVLDRVSLKSNYQGIDATCEVLVNNELKFRSTTSVNPNDLDSYSIVVDDKQFGVLYKNEVVYTGQVTSLNLPYIILGSSPREYDQNIQTKHGLYDLRRYLSVPQNIDVTGRFVQLEVTLDDYNNNISKLNSITPVIQYTDPIFPKRPKIVDVF